MSDKIIVTGALGILGQAVVAHLVKTGATVTAIDLAADNGSSAAQHVIGGVDLTNEAAVQTAFAAAKEKMEGLTGIANIAGGFIWQTVADGEIDGFDKMFRINLKTAAIASRTAFSLFEGDAAIVNIGASAVKAPGLGMAAYTASKAGVHALTESLAEEGASAGVRVNAVLPTILDTPTNRADMPDADTSSWVKPEAAAEVIGFLLSGSSRAITGALVPVNRGG
ncbi:MAG: SDR family NAD(P)-dependent oxidoreductase [Maricaulis sp.]|uniref:SDR family NAD(P)-dependent oxidoreductase n=1 Tax=Maricaulis sp. TaxID=1486257 RepID=UPI001B1E5C5A|nr:SDR family NAD(P)-dependent oxidoreductase [Maricaulis sp.]MBO6729279.1 SDR family NAD(P)-dependent oxidoreductase [Maricaulis sp.]MBO6846048.1 SDR family NAD(P)-dependent oxidoreductase [Maricaulis sp.]MBO6876076.1 SDR family NAD(P)-dependent oxidoreductase [Maricaulis sp.]